MTRCCSNIFLNQFTQQPPDVIVDPPAATLCYHYEDVSVPSAGLFTLTIDYTTIDGVQTVINKEVFNDWGFDFSQFNYTQVVSDLGGFAFTAGVTGMGFFIASYDPDVGFRFSITADGVAAASITYTYDIGAGPVQVTAPLTGSNCNLALRCFEASYTPENPFSIDWGNILAVTNEGLTLFETVFSAPPCTQFNDPAFLALFIRYVQTLHGTQASATIDFAGNTATVRIIDSLLVPAHMDNNADSGCMPPNSTPQVNNFSLITCP